MGDGGAFVSLVNAASNCWRQHVHFARRQEILSSGLLKARIGLVISGMALHQRRVRQTEWQAIDVILPGDLVGLEAAILGRDSTELRAASPVVIAEADVGAFRRALGSSVFSETVITALLKRQRRLEDRIVRLGRLQAGQRVATFLLHMHQRLGAGHDGGADALQIALTQRDLANLLGLTTVHVSRVLHKMRENNIISFRRGVVTIDDFEALCGVACDNGAISPAGLGLQGAGPCRSNRVSPHRHD